MNPEITGLRVAGMVFALMALVQIARLIVQPEILVAGSALPLWPSMLAVVILVVLSVWMFSLAGDEKGARA
jgi:hypothetical protein